MEQPCSLNEAYRVDMDLYTIVHNSHQLDFNMLKLTFYTISQYQITTIIVVNPGIFYTAYEIVEIYMWLSVPN